MGVCLGKLPVSCFWRSGVDMGVGWAGWRFPLLGSRSVIQILLSHCILMRLTAKQGLEPPQLNFRISYSMCPSRWPSLPKDAAQPAASSYLLPVLYKLSACIS